MALFLAFAKAYWLQLVLILGGVAIGFIAAWQLQGLKLDALENDFGTYRNQVERQALEARQAALKQKEAWLKEKDDAEQKANEREAKLRKDLAAAQSASRGLRDDIATLRARLPNAIPSAVIATADTLAGLLDQCQQEYRGMAEVADGHREDIRTLIDAWPK